MKRIDSHFSIGAIALVGLLSIGTAGAAVIIEPNGKASANFSAGTAFGNSTTAGSGTLLAPGLTFGAASVFGGEAYTYTYTPSSLLDNTSFSSASVLNSPANLFASGLTGGVAGIYNVYHVFPDTSNAGGQPTRYEVRVNGILNDFAIQDQNITDGANGIGTGLWELIGQATVPNASDIITVTADVTTASNSVGVRTAGVLFEYAGPIPEPSFALLIGLGAFAFLGRRNR